MNLSETPLCTKQGVIPVAERQKQLRIAYDPVRRNAENPAILTNEDYRQLRKDRDRRIREAHENNMHARDEDEWDFKAYKLNDGIKSTECATTDEESEQYLEAFPNLADRLFETLQVIREPYRVDNLTQDDIDYCSSSFNGLAQAFQTDSISLEQRMFEIGREFREFQACAIYVKNSVKSAISSLKDIIEDADILGDIPSDGAFMEVMSSLENSAKDFELYWMAMSSSSKKLGRLRVQKQIYKMFNTMIFNTRIIRTVNENRRKNIEQLQMDFDRAKQLLQENNIPFIPDSHELHHPHLRRRSSQFCKEVLKYIPKLKGKQANCFAVVHDFVRRELYWPWSREVTRLGLRQTISVGLMIIAIGVYMWKFFLSQA